MATASAGLFLAAIPPAGDGVTYRELALQQGAAKDDPLDAGALERLDILDAANAAGGLKGDARVAGTEIPIVDGGVEYLGGTNELYGNTNAADSLTAIKKAVFDDKKYTLAEVTEAMNKNFEGFEDMIRALINAPKYGNDDSYADDIAVDIHNYICNGIRNSAKDAGLFSYLVVIINNQVNTEWGRATSASADGRLSGVYMSNANNPQSGADKNGPTAMLNSLVKLKADLHAGSVQNIKFSKNMFNSNRDIMKGMFRTYFENGGPQLMVTVVGKGELEEAYKDPGKYPNLVVRVGGFSAKFVNLDRDVQEEILNRTLND